MPPLVFSYIGFKKLWEIPVGENPTINAVYGRKMPANEEG